MKHLYVGAAILALCLALCTTTTALLSRDVGKAAAALERAEQAAALGDFDSAAQLTAQAQRFWESRRGFFGMVLRHSEADQVNASFRALLVYARNHCAEEFGPNCAALIGQIQHLSEMEMPYYYNILAASGPKSS